MSCLIVRNEKLTGRKLTGCILGFAGVCRDQSSWKFFGFRLYDDGRRIRFDFTVSLCNIHDIDQLLFKKVSPVIFKWKLSFLLVELYYF
mgnify:CR=1 FL=1